MKKLFDTGCGDEFGNPYLIEKCDHEEYRKDCSYCNDVLSYISYGAKEGHSVLEDMEIAFYDGTRADKKKAWTDMKEYYNKWSDYEPECESMEDRGDDSGMSENTEHYKFK